MLEFGGQEFFIELQSVSTCSLFDARRDKKGFFAEKFCT